VTRSGSLFTSQEDRREGVIATLTDGYVMHAPGSKRDALRTIAAECDRRDVKVLCISSPQSIYRDLFGSREERHKGATVTGADWESPAEIVMPERQLLGHIGRLDLAL